MLAFDLPPGDIRPLRRVEYEQLVGSATFDGERVELLEGVVVRMSPHGPLHDSVIEMLTRLLATQLPTDCSLRVQSAFAATDGSEPEPDLAVVPFSGLRSTHPDRAMLVIEVADASLSRDKTLKARIYAAASVPEYWVVDLNSRTVHVHTQPAADGYALVTTVAAGESLCPMSLPSVTIHLSEVF